MLYEVTFLFSTDYCQYKPDDPGCHNKHQVEARSQFEAVSKLHNDLNATPNYRDHNVIPEVWNVVEVRE